MIISIGGNAADDIFTGDIMNMCHQVSTALSNLNSSHSPGEICYYDVTYSNYDVTYSYYDVTYSNYDVTYSNYDVTYSNYDVTYSNYDV